MAYLALNGLHVFLYLCLILLCQTQFQFHPQASRIGSTLSEHHLSRLFYLILLKLQKQNRNPQQS